MFKFPAQQARLPPPNLTCYNYPLLLPPLGINSVTSLNRFSIWSSVSLEAFAAQTLYFVTSNYEEAICVSQHWSFALHVCASGNIPPSVPRSSCPPVSHPQPSYHHLLTEGRQPGPLSGPESVQRTPARLWDTYTLLSRAEKQRRTPGDHCRGHRPWSHVH